MADVGEKAALYLIQLLELLIALLELLAVGVELKTQGEFAETYLVIKPTAGDNEDPGNKEEIKVVKENAAVGDGARGQDTGGQISGQGKDKNEDAVQQRPPQQQCRSQYHEVQTRVIRGERSIGVIDHPGN